MTDSHDDEMLSALMDEYGAEGYGVYWIIVELIGNAMDKSDRCETRHSIKKWSKTCGVSVKKFRKIAGFLADFEQNLKKPQKFFLEFNENYLTIKYPKLLKFRDEYSRKKKEKSGECPDTVGSLSGACPASETETETETETDKSQKPAPSGRPSADFSGNENKHFSVRVGEYFKSIEAHCKTISSLPQKKGRTYNPYQWVQKRVNAKSHPGAINETLEALAAYWAQIENPAGYAESIMKTKNQNWNEREVLEHAAEIKAGFDRMLKNAKAKQLALKVGVKV